MIEVIRSGAIDKVLVWSLCRVGPSSELVGFLETCRARGVALYLHEQQIDTATSNGVSLLDVAPLMVHHLRQSRRSKILRGQASARALSIKFGRPRIATIRVEKAKRELVLARACVRSHDWPVFPRRLLPELKTSMSAEAVKI